MLNIKALKEEKNSLVEEKRSLLTNAINETRSLEGVENERLNVLTEKINNLDLQIVNAEKELRESSVEENIKKEGEMKMSKQLNEKRAIENFIKNGVVAEEIRATNTSANNASIQPVYVQNEIIRRLEEVAPVFAKAQRYQATAGELRVPRENASNLWDYGFVGEDADVSEHAFSFDTCDLKQVRVGACVKVTQQLLNDADKRY